MPVEECLEIARESLLHPQPTRPRKLLRLVGKGQLMPHIWILPPFPKGPHELVVGSSLVSIDPRPPKQHVVGGATVVDDVELVHCPHQPYN